jgi:hypothetical protein
METLKIRFAVAVHPDGRFNIECISETFDRSGDRAMSKVLSNFDKNSRADLQRYWVDVELPIPESPIPVHRATVTPVEPETES